MQDIRLAECEREGDGDRKMRLLERRRRRGKQDRGGGHTRENGEGNMSRDHTNQHGDAALDATPGQARTDTGAGCADTGTHGLAQDGKI